VGVAILAESGETFTGGNAENISFGFTLWAAAFAAIIAGYRQFAGIAVAACTEKPMAPCRAWHQVLAEFHSSLPSYAARREGAHKVWTLAELFPSSFDRM
jgi:cytidine deaminase